MTYLHAAGRAAPDGLALERSMTFFFRNAILVGHQIVSSFPDDRTDFDDAKVKAIRVGATTRSRGGPGPGRGNGAEKRA